MTFFFRKKRENDARRQSERVTVVIGSADACRAPEWVDSMHLFYKKNGFYKPTDLYRVLGDPVKPVTIERDDRASCLASSLIGKGLTTQEA